MEKYIKGNKYKLSDNITEFKNITKFIVQITGGFVGMAIIYIVTNDGNIFWVTSHSAYDTENIENESVVGKYMGKLSIDITDICVTGKNELKKKNFFMDSIVTTVLYMKNVPNCNVCYIKEDNEVRVRVDTDWEKYEQIIKDINNLEKKRWNVK